MYSHNKSFFTFFFSIVNEQESNVLYFTMRRSYQEVINIGQSRMGNIIEGDEQEVRVFENNQFRGSQQEIMSNYMTTTTFEKLVFRLRNIFPDQNSESLAKPKHPDGRVHLTFEKCMDSRVGLDYIPLIYQLVADEDQPIDFSTHHFIMFDVKKQKVVRHYNMLPNMFVRQ